MNRCAFLFLATVVYFFTRFVACFLGCCWLLLAGAVLSVVVFALFVACFFCPCEALFFDGKQTPHAVLPCLVASLTATSFFVPVQFFMSMHDSDLW